jgi:hypothetical protein
MVHTDPATSNAVAVRPLWAILWLVGFIAVALSYVADRFAYPGLASLLRAVAVLAVIGFFLSLMALVVRRRNQDGSAP